ncbi:MAG: hypothetical protein JWQ49_3845 [Edaphobacter sp.]|nr:hypothetical protein [Edaphobacter sp.]
MTEKLPLKSSTDFPNNEAWRAYVRQNVPQTDVDYVLARGRTTLFVKFYETRKQPFPESFQTELLAIERLSEPERTATLDGLNNRILADMGQFLFTAARPKPEESESVLPTTPTEIAEDLLAHLRKRNPYFAIWAHYTEGVARSGDAPAWEEFASRELGQDSGDELMFTLRMAELGKLLHRYRDGGLPLPPRTYYQISLLHHAQGKERNLQVRVLVQQLLEAMTLCASA